MYSIVVVNIFYSNIRSKIFSSLEARLSDKTLFRYMALTQNSLPFIYVFLSSAQEEIAQRLLTEDGEPKLSSLDLINDDNDNDSMASTFSDGTITPIESFPLSNQSKLRASLDKSILLQRRWLLEGKGERVEKELTDEIREAQEAIRRAREVEEERRKLEELRKEKLEEERCALIF